MSFEETLEDAGPKGVRTGNPVLPELAHMDRDEERKAAVERFDLDADRKTLLVFGGSQGARRINQAVPGLVGLWSDKEDRQILHITGSSAATQADEVADSGKLIYRRVDFVERMQEPYAVADLALVAGVRRPLPSSARLAFRRWSSRIRITATSSRSDTDVLWRARGPHVVIPDEETTAERVGTEADAILSDDDRLDSMRKAALAAGNPDAARALAEVVREVAA